VRRLHGWQRAGMSYVTARQGYLSARQGMLRTEIAELKERLALADAAARLSQFLANRAAPGTYGQFRALLGEVRADFDQLSAELAQARSEWLASGASGMPPLERIVLYIDDLDRCPPGKVVEVLEAIHLMLALDLFVVVVAVDGRWLTRCLEHQHHELFDRGHPKGGSAEPADRGGMASPADYLDKIFQIPYAVTPPPPAAIASYIRSLLPVPAPEAPQEPTTGNSEPPHRPDDSPGTAKAPPSGQGTHRELPLPPDPPLPAYRSSLAIRWQDGSVTKGVPGRGQDI
jgi:hypothetical protein